MKVEMEISDQLISDQIESGFAFIGYWAQDWEIDVVNHTGWVQEVEDGDKPEPITLNFEKAVKIAAEKYPRILDENQMDAETGDMLIQLAAFGDIVYG